MERSVSDSRSIRAQAHMRREGLHSRTKSDFPAASALQKLWLSFLRCTAERHKREYWVFNVIARFFISIFHLHFLKDLWVFCFKFMVVVQLLLYITVLEQLRLRQLRPSWIHIKKIKKITLYTVVCSSKARSRKHSTVCQIYSLMVVGCHWCLAQITKHPTYSLLHTHTHTLVNVSLWDIYI